jgi:hypothetical protein
MSRGVYLKTVLDEIEARKARCGGTHCEPGLLHDALCCMRGARSHRAAVPGRPTRRRHRLGSLQRSHSVCVSALKAELQQGKTDRAFARGQRLHFCWAFPHCARRGARRCVAHCEGACVSSVGCRVPTVDVSGAVVVTWPEETREECACNTANKIYTLAFSK